MLSQAVPSAPPSPIIADTPEEEMTHHLTQQEITQAIHQLIANQNLIQQALTRISNAAPTNTVNASKVVSKPQVYNGKRGEDARQFIAAFELWAGNNPTLTGSYQKKIKAAVSFLEGDAAIWATPYTETINQHNADPTIAFPFNSWNMFQQAFKARFETADAEVDAKEALRTLWQGRKSVANYVATFKQYSSRTEYSDKDLRDRLYDHLADRVKDGLVNTTSPMKTFDELVNAAIAVDLRQIQRAKEKGKSIVDDTYGSTNPYPTPYTKRDPNAMEVDASFTRKSTDDYKKFMVGRCYGCGLREHRKAEGHHERDICSHCGMTGHLAPVCRRKFFGQTGQRQKTASTSSATESVSYTPGLNEIGAVLQQLTASQKSVTDKLEAMQQGF